MSRYIVLFKKDVLGGTSEIGGNGPDQHPTHLSVRISKRDRNRKIWIRCVSKVGDQVTGLCVLNYAINDWRLTAEYRSRERQHAANSSNRK